MNSLVAVFRNLTMANIEEFATHVVAYATFAVAAIAFIQVGIGLAKAWVVQWFPNSKTAPVVFDKINYGFSAAADLIEKLALNWVRGALVPKKWDGVDRRDDKKASNPNDITKP